MTVNFSRDKFLNQKYNEASESFIKIYTSLIKVYLCLTGYPISERDFYNLSILTTIKSPAFSE